MLRNIHGIFRPQRFLNKRRIDWHVNLGKERFIPVVVSSQGRKSHIRSDDPPMEPVEESAAPVVIVTIEEEPTE